MGNLIGSAFNYATQWGEILHDTSELRDVLTDSVITKITTQTASVSFFGSHQIIILHLTNKNKSMDITTSTNNIKYKIAILPDYVHALQITQFPLLSTHTYDIHISSPISIKYNKNIKTEYVESHSSKQKQSLFNNLSPSTDDNSTNYYGLIFDSTFHQFNSIKLSSTHTNSELKATLSQMQLFSDDIINIICSYAFHEVEHIIIHAPKFNWKVHRTANIAVRSSIRNMAAHQELSMKYIDFRAINEYNVSNGQLNLTLHKNICLKMDRHKLEYSNLILNNSIHIEEVACNELDSKIYRVCIPFHDYKIVFPQLFIRMDELLKNIEHLGQITNKKILEIYPSDDDNMRKVSKGVVNTKGFINLLRNFCGGMIIEGLSQHRAGLYQHFKAGSLYLWDLDVINHCNCTVFKNRQPSFHHSFGGTMGYY